MKYKNLTYRRNASLTHVIISPVPEIRFKKNHVHLPVFKNNVNFQ
jgi:hypothetical protein